MKDTKAALFRLVGVEEHVTFPELTKQLPIQAAIDRGYKSADSPFGNKISFTDVMEDTDKRLEKLDQAGITVQVLSYPFAGADLLSPRAGAKWAAAMNDGIARRVAEHPDRYAAFASLGIWARDYK